MKPPKCRLCHKEHYGLCGNLGPASVEQAPVVSGDVASRRKPVNHRPQPVGDITAKAHDYGGHGNEVGSITVQALKMEQARTVTTSSGPTTSNTYALTEDEIRDKLERGDMSETLTSSARGRKFREAGGEALRKANRLRMRAKRSK